MEFDEVDPCSSYSDELDSDDEPRFPDFDHDAEFQEHETVKILAYGMGRALVRNKLSDNEAVTTSQDSQSSEPNDHRTRIARPSRPLVQNEVLQLRRPGADQ